MAKHPVYTGLVVLALGGCSGDSGGGTDSDSATVGTTGGSGTVSATSVGTASETSASSTDASTSGSGTGGACPAVGPWPSDPGPWPVSRTMRGLPAGSGADPTLTADGRWFAYASNQDVTGEENDGFVWDSYLYDARCDTTRRLPSDNPLDVLFPVISDDGSTVAFVSSTAMAAEVYAWDVDTNTLEEISVLPGGGLSGSANDAPAISADGRYVVFHSLGELTDDDSNGLNDVFLRDRENETTELVSVATDGTQGNSFSNFPEISADGRYVTFESLSSNFVQGVSVGVQIFVRDRQEQTTEVVSLTPSDMTSGMSLRPDISDDGQTVVFQSLGSGLVPDDGNGLEDVFVHDRMTGTTERVSVDSMGDELAEPSGFGRVSGDGNLVVFEVGTVNATQIWLRNRAAGTTTLVSMNLQGDPSSGSSSRPSISTDGAWVTFGSSGDDLVEDPAPGGFEAFAVAIVE